MRDSDEEVMTARETFQQRQRACLDYEFSFTDGEEAARAQFERLALRTYDQLAQAGKPPYALSVEAHRTFNLIDERNHIRASLSPDLLQEWKAWEHHHDDLMSRNPRLALHDLMQGIGETHDASRWPCGLEPAISDWIDGGQREPMPFDDRYDIITPDFYERLQRARRRAGGFLFFISETGVVFLPELDWQRKKASEIARRDALSDQQRRAFRKADQFQLRMAKILVLARGDPDFWGALRGWESEREANRPATGPADDHGGGLAGPIAISRRTADASETNGIASDAIPLDPLLADFIGRIHTPEDDEIGLTTPLVVAILRGTARDELGFDGTLVWPGGPSLGEGGP